MFLINDPVQEQDIAKPKPNHTRKVSMEYITVVVVISFVFNGMSGKSNNT